MLPPASRFYGLWRSACSVRAVRTAVFGCIAWWTAAHGVVGVPPGPLSQTAPKYHLDTSLMEHRVNMGESHHDLAK